ncbi:hypothetical protein RIR_jg29206.t1 [Rhizophagus irregularis DAOM 181602=DAOM 197198]|nr:hypothetical protein RIR_jg29206.t1 [Rhizophagus irregularis DAOM 181602=DAOM 197198]
MTNKMIQINYMIWLVAARNDVMSKDFVYPHNPTPRFGFIAPIIDILDRKKWSSASVSRAPTENLCCSHSRIANKTFRKPERGIGYSLKAQPKYSYLICVMFCLRLL